MTDIEYPTFTSKIGIDPLLCRVDNDADNIFDLEVNGNLCDKQKGHNDSCKGDNVFIKQSMTNRLNNKYGDNTFINNNKNKIIAMMKHPNYSKSLCHNTLNSNAYSGKMTYSHAVLPYNYEYCDSKSPCNNYKNTIYEKTNTIPHNMVNYGSKDENNTSLSSEIFDNETNNKIIDDSNNELCNNFYKVYCEKLNSMLKDKFGDKFDTSMLGEYENMCLCYQDLYKDYLPVRVYDGFYGKDEKDIANEIANKEIKPILSNGAKMIDPVCDHKATQIGTKGRYAPITNENWDKTVSVNIAICNNTLNMNDTNIESNDDSTIKFNQSSLCSANSNPNSNNTPKTDDKTTDKSDITDKETDIKDNTETKESETKDNKLPSDSDNKDSNANDPNKSNNSNINDSNNLESTKDKIINKIKENKTYAGIGGGVSLCCCCICCICIIMILSK